MVKKSVAALAALASLAATDAFMAPASVGVAARRAIPLAASPQRRAVSLRGGATQAQMASFYDFELPLVGECAIVTRLGGFGPGGPVAYCQCTQRQQDCERCKC